MKKHRSGDYSLDPAFDPEELFDAVARGESRDLIEDAFRTHVKPTDPVPEAVTRAIAVYVRAAHQRGHRVEHVVRDLEAIQTRLEGMRLGLATDPPSELRRAVLRGILLAFYGGEAVAREDERRAARKPPRNVEPKN